MQKRFELKVFWKTNPTIFNTSSAQQIELREVPEARFVSLLVQNRLILPSKISIPTQMYSPTTAIS